jgi:Glycosyl transferase family 2
VSAAPEVTVVFETENELAGHSIRLRDVMRAWLRQTARSRVAEWIVVSQRSASAEEQDLMRQAPAARWLQRPESRYYGQKNEGILEARSRFIALADSDAMPADDWLENALSVLENGEPSIALVTGRTRYQTGPFSREMAIAQLPNQADQPHDTTHFLAHNVLLAAEAVRPRLFARGEVRQGSDTYLAEQLLKNGFRVRYDPSLRVIHNYGTGLGEIYRHSLTIGYSYGRFQESIGEPHSSRIWDFAGRVRTLVARWRVFHRPLGLTIWRFPVSLFFFFGFSAAVAHGYEMAVRHKPEPFAKF